MRRLSFLLGVGLAFCSLRAEMPAEAVRAMADAERKFYQAGQEKGTRAAFLEFLVDDAIVFRPGPVNGKESWSNRPETGLDLVWEPSFAAIARSGDFGYDTGPAKWRAKKADEKFSGYGYFISIWKRQKDGSWKVVLDCGTENPEPTGVPEPLRFDSPAAKGDRKIDVTASRKSWQETQSTFVTMAKFDSQKPFGNSLRIRCAFYRDGSHFPRAGKKPQRMPSGRNKQG